jgi:DNA ligase (NAD+)
MFYAYSIHKMPKGDSSANYDYKKINNDPWKYAKTITNSQLVKLLKHLSEHYYNTEEALVEDDTYDTLKDILEERDPENDFLTTIGAPVKNDKKKVELKYYAASLDKKKPFSKELERWINKYSKNDKVISHKLDGISAVFSKDKKGTLMLCTRGDGFEGQDISHLIEYIFGDIFLKELPNGPWFVRGELIISKSNFEKLKKKIETGAGKKLKNGRNIIPGLLNSKTIDKRREQIADVTEFITYTVFEPSLKPSEQMKWLDDNGFDVVKYEIVEDELTTELLLEKLKEAKKESKYEIDGLVVMDDSLNKIIRGKKPKYAFAFKQLSKHEVADVEVLDVEWNASIDGYLKPRIFIETAYLAGVEINRATAFNGKYIFDNKIGKGSVVQVVRSGDVIPHIISIVKKTKALEPKGTWKWNSTKVDIIGTDPMYKKQILIKLITNFFRVIGVDNVSIGIIKKFVNSGYNSIKKILIMDVDDIADIKGMGEKIGKKIIKNMKLSLENITLEQLMTASHSFGRGFGEKKLSLILKEYPDIFDWDYSNEKLIKKIEKIEGYNTLTATKFVEKLPDFKEFLEEMKDIINVKKIIKKQTEKSDIEHDDIFNNQVIVFTGFRNKHLKKDIEDRGGRVATTVSGKTTLVIADDITKTESKITTAKELGIKLLSYEDFVNKYNLAIDV